MGGLVNSSVMKSTSSNAIHNGQITLKKSAQSLTTGKNANVDVVSQRQGNSLNDQSFILKAVQKNLGYTSNVLSTSISSTETIVSNLLDMIGIVTQSQSGSDSNRVIMNDMLQQKMGELSKLRDGVNFDKKSLLTGDLGQDNTVRSNFKNSALNATVAPAANTFDATASVAASTPLRMANVVAGDSITFAGVKFTAVAGEPTNENEFRFSTNSDVETARNLGLAIQKNKSENIQAYKVEVNGTDVVFTQISAAKGSVPITPHANMAIQAGGAVGVSGAIDLSGIRNAEGFNQPLVFKGVASSAAAAGAKALAEGAGNALAKATAANANDRAVVVQTVVGGRTFTGALFYANGGNVSGKEIKMICDATGEEFKVNTDAGYHNTRANLDAANSADLIAADLTTLFKGAEVKETKTLKINTDKGDISYKGNVIASTKGMSVKLTAGDFDQLKFKDFKIEMDKNPANVGRVVFTAIIEGKDPKTPSTYRVDNINIGTLTDGSILTLTDTSGSGNTLSINLGEKGLIGMKETTLDVIADAYKDVMMNKGDGLQVRTGLDFSNTTQINIGDLSDSKLYVNNKGEYQSKISLLTTADAAVANEVITNALSKVRNEQQKLQSQQKNLQESSDIITRNIQVSEEAASGYLDTDIMEASQKFSEAMKAMNSAAIVMQGADSAMKAIISRVLEGIAH
jgi:flagellin-like hook-associated protein FlgL